MFVGVLFIILCAPAIQSHSHEFVYWEWLFHAGIMDLSIFAGLFEEKRWSITLPRLVFHDLSFLSRPCLADDL